LVSVRMAAANQRTLLARTLRAYPKD